MNLEKNCIPNLLIDVGNSLIKFGIFSNEKWYIKRIKTSQANTAKIVHIIRDFIKKFMVAKVYICSVVKKMEHYLRNGCSKLKLIYYFIQQTDFAKLLSFSSKDINISEVGNDILIILYYIRNLHNLIVCNFGSALVTIKKTQKIDGVLIYPDLKEALRIFLKKIKLDSSISVFKEFGNSTSQAISGALYYLIDGYINNILSDNPSCSKILYSGGNRQIMQLVNISKNIAVVEIDEIILTGMQDFVCNHLEKKKQ